MAVNEIVFMRHNESLDVKSTRLAESAIFVLTMNEATLKKDDESFVNTTPVFCFISGSGIGTVEAFLRRFLQHFRMFHTQSVFFRFQILHC